jgi:hypothetical protein
VISELESERESENKEEDDITCANKYLNQDLNKKLGLDRLNKEDTDKSDTENCRNKAIVIRESHDWGDRLNRVTKLFLGKTR